MPTFSLNEYIGYTQSINNSRHSVIITITICRLRAYVLKNFESFSVLNELLIWDMQQNQRDPRRLVESRSGLKLAPPPISRSTLNKVLNLPQL